MSFSRGALLDFVRFVTPAFAPTSQNGQSRAFFRFHNPIMTLKNIKRRTLPINLQLIHAESVPRAVARAASASNLLQ